MNVLDNMPGLLPAFLRLIMSIINDMKWILGRYTLGRCVVSCHQTSVNVVFFSLLFGKLLLHVFHGTMEWTVSNPRTRTVIIRIYSDRIAGAYNIVLRWLYFRENLMLRFVRQACLTGLYVAL